MWRCRYMVHIGSFSFRNATFFGAPPPDGRPFKGAAAATSMRCPSTRLSSKSFTAAW